MRTKRKMKPVASSTPLSSLPRRLLLPPLLLLLLLLDILSAPTLAFPTLQPRHAQPQPQPQPQPQSPPEQQQQQPSPDSRSGAAGGGGVSVLDWVSFAGSVAALSLAGSAVRRSGKVSESMRRLEQSVKQLQGSQHEHDLSLDAAAQRQATPAAKLHTLETLVSSLSRRLEAMDPAGGALSHDAQFLRQQLRMMQAELETLRSDMGYSSSEDISGGGSSSSGGGGGVGGGNRVQQVEEWRPPSDLTGRRNMMDCIYRVVDPHVHDSIVAGTDLSWAIALCAQDILGLSRVPNEWAVSLDATYRLPPYTPAAPATRAPPPADVNDPILNLGETPQKFSQADVEEKQRGLREMRLTAGGSSSSSSGGGGGGGGGRGGDWRIQQRLRALEQGVRQAVGRFDAMKLVLGGAAAAPAAKAGRPAFFGGPRLMFHP